MDLQTCHEFPSVIDPGSERHALEFKEVMDATPADLKTWPANIYSQIAIAIKGGALREPGLANLAGRLAVRVARNPVETPSKLGRMKRRSQRTTGSNRGSNRESTSRAAATPSCDVSLGGEHPSSPRNCSRVVMCPSGENELIRWATWSCVGACNRRSRWRRLCKRY